MLDPKAFKAYDVRGQYPEELDEDGAYAIGRAYVQQFEPRLRRHIPLNPDSLDRVKSALCDVVNVEKGTASKADVKGYYVGGKTGTSEKVVAGRYSKTKVLTSFTAVLPADQPRYLLLIMLDEPQPTADTHGYATSGWNAVPVGGAVIARIAPLLGIEPRFELPASEKLILASAGGR